MRKVNRIMMATVSVLLALVLLTTSILSGVYAKFTETDTASINAGFKALGVSVDLTFDETKISQHDITVSPSYEDAENKEEAIEADKKDGQYTVALSGVRLAPGDNLDDLVKFHIYGTPNVDVKVNIDVDVSYDVASFTLAKNAGNLKAGDVYVPLYFTLGLGENSSEKLNIYVPRAILAPVVDEEGETDGEATSLPTAYGDEIECTMFYESDAFPTNNGVRLSEAFTNVNYTGSRNTTDHTKTDFSIEQVIKLGSNQTRSAVGFQRGGNTYNHLNFGFNWPYEVSADNNKIDAQLCSQTAQPTFNISFTVTVEQIKSDYTTPTVS